MKYLWVVDKYMDSIKRKLESSALATFMNAPMYPHRFETLAEARKFIVDRANEQIYKAREAVKKAEARFRKCVAKFGADE